MDNQERFIYLGIIVVLVGYFVYYTFFNNVDYIDIYKQEIAALDAKIDSLHSENDHLTVTIDSLNYEISTLDKEIDAQDKKIDNIRKKANEKVSTVDSFDISQLTEFFTDRYGYLFSNPTGADSTRSN